MTSICVFGAGAIGGLMAAKLEMAGTPVTVVARGPHGDAMRAKGLVLLSDGKETVTEPRVASDPKEIGPQDYLVLTLKAHSLLPAMAQLKPLIGPNTTIVAAINGVPWWYTYKLGGRLRRPDHRVGRSRRRADAQACRRRRCSAASSIRLPTSSSPASSTTPTATASRWASRTAAAANARRSFPSC